MPSDRFRIVRRSESGNVLFYILIGIVLVALVTAAIRMGGGEGENMDKEQTAIAASQIRQYATEIERAVAILMQNGISETDVRFGYPGAASEYGLVTDTPTRQVFDRAGGGAAYQLPPAGVNDGSRWEFYGGTSFPLVGSPSRSALYAVLPHVTPAMCTKLNAMNGYAAGTQPADTGTCLNFGASGRFGDGKGYDDTGGKNTVNAATFSVQPSVEACVVCDDGQHYYYRVLIAR